RSGSHGSRSMVGRRALLRRYRSALPLAKRKRMQLGQVARSTRERRACAPYRVRRFFACGIAINRRITSSNRPRSTGAWCFSSRSRRSSAVYLRRLFACEARRLFLAAGPRPLDCMGGSSASCQDRVEDFAIVAVIEAPRELVEVERQVFLADLVERADD